MFIYRYTNTYSKKPNARILLDGRNKGIENHVKIVRFSTDQSVKFKKEKFKNSYWIKYCSHIIKSEPI